MSRPPRDLEGQVLLVSGGSRGIGRAIVCDAALRGARVAFSCRALGPESDATIEEAARGGGPDVVFGVTADVARETDVEAFFDTALERFGRIDAVVHNAAINRDALLVQSSADTFDEVLATNLTGAFLLARRAVQEFLAAGTDGRVVFIGSVSDRGGTSQTAYAASKGGLRGLARTVAKEYGHKSIRANVLVAGLVETTLTAQLPDRFRQLFLSGPLRRVGLASEVAAAALYLASPAARFINGETVYASGGIVEVNG
jgi:3-oxoacyl-[acyl-carrier protein] reductase